MPRLQNFRRYVRRRPIYRRTQPPRHNTGKDDDSCSTTSSERNGLYMCGCCGELYCWKCKKARSFNLALEIARQRVALAAERKRKIESMLLSYPILSKRTKPSSLPCRNSELEDSDEWESVASEDYAPSQNNNINTASSQTRLTMAAGPSKIKIPKSMSIFEHYKRKLHKLLYDKTSSNKQLRFDLGSKEKQLFPEDSSFKHRSNDMKRVIRRQFLKTLENPTSDTLLLANLNTFNIASRNCSNGTLMSQIKNSGESKGRGPYKLLKKATQNYITINSSTSMSRTFFNCRNLQREE